MDDWLDRFDWPQGGPSMVVMPSVTVCPSCDRVDGIQVNDNGTTFCEVCDWEDGHYWWQKEGNSEST